MNVVAYLLAFLIISISITVLSGIGLVVVVAVFAEELLMNNIDIVIGIFAIGALGTFLFVMLLLRLALEC